MFTRILLECLLNFLLDPYSTFYSTFARLFTPLFTPLFLTVLWWASCRYATDTMFINIWWAERWCDQHLMSWQMMWFHQHLMSFRWRMVDFLYTISRRNWTDWSSRGRRSSRVWFSIDFRPTVLTDVCDCFRLIWVCCSVDFGLFVWRTRVACGRGPSAFYPRWGGIHDCFSTRFDCFSTDFRSILTGHRGVGGAGMGKCRRHSAILLTLHLAFPCVYPNAPRFSLLYLTVPLLLACFSLISPWISSCLS